MIAFTIAILSTVFAVMCVFGACLKCYNDESRKEALSKAVTETKKVSKREEETCLQMEGILDYSFAMMLHH